MRCETHRFACQIFRHACHLEQNAPWFDHCYPSCWRAFTATHAGLRGLFGVWLVREDPNPYLSATPHVTSHRDTGRFDLIAGHPAGF